MLVLDDLHWSDDASLELIGALLRRGLDRPVLLALAYRPGQAPQRLLAALSGADVTQLRLAPLSEAESATLLGEAAGGAGQAAALYRNSGGNPFYLEQLVRAGPAALTDAGAANGSGIPPAVTAALVEELAALGPDSRRLIDAAAIAGEPFEPDLARAVAQLDAERRPRRARRPARARPRPADRRAAVVLLPAPARPPDGLRDDPGGLADRGARARRRGARAPRRARGRSRAAHRAVRRARRRGGDRPADRRGRAGGAARAGHRRALVRGRAAAAARATITSARSTSASRSPRRCAPRASSTAAARCCSRPRTSSPPAPTPAASSSSRCAPRSSTGSATTRRRTTG